MADVCLVLMPYAAIERPSIALGLLKACLEESKIQTSVLYPNIWFAEEIGLCKYSVISGSRPELLMGEWTFSGVAFPDFQLDYSEYFSDIAYKNADMTQALWWVRSRAAAFIERVAQSVLDLQPHIVSCSSTFQQHCASLALLRRIRELAPEVITLMGGANCEGPMGVATQREFPWVDFVCSGEGDTLLPALCRKLLDKGRDIAPEELPYGVIGPGHRRNSAVVGEAPRASVQDLDRVPVPDYDDYFQTLRTSTIAPYIDPGLFIETSRGCWWGQKKHCTFCGLNGNSITYRSKSPNRVVEEFSQLSQRYGLRKFEVVDNILDMTHINTVLPVFAALDDLYSIFYETKANLKYQQVQQLAEAGVRWIQPGIESMHDTALKLLNKGNTALMNVQLLKWAREFGIFVDWNFLIGIPGESGEWYAGMIAWLPLIVHLQPPSATYPLRYDRFSLYHERPADYGLTLLPNRAYSYVYPLLPEAMTDLAYFFEDHSDRTCEKLPRANGHTADWRDTGIIPEHQTLQAWIAQWGNLFWSEHPPILRIIGDKVDRLKIVDTRPCATESELSLEGLTYQVYMACDRAVTPRELVEALHRQYGLDVSWNDVQPVVDELRARKIVLDLDGRLLSLGVRGPIPPLPESREHPGGHIHIQQFLRVTRQQLQSQRPAWSTIWK